MGAAPSEVSWPALDAVIADARRVGADAVADALVQAVTTDSTSGEILASLGQLMRDHRALRAQLQPAVQTQWDAVLADVHRAYPGSRFWDWLAALFAKSR